MKKVILMLIPAVFFLIIAFPQTAFQGASSGLLIWFQKLLPTLLPFMILSNLCISTGFIQLIADKWNSRGNPCAWITMLFGLTLGLPVGAKMASDFVRKKSLSQNQGTILLCTCNHVSPAFVGGYLLTQSLNMPQLILPSYLILYLPPFLICLCLLSLTQPRHLPAPKKEASRFCCSFQILDACIMNGFEIITKLGGYLILFGMMGAYLQLLPIRSATSSAVIMGLLEITTGIHHLAQCPLTPSVMYVAAMTLMSFGGLCTFAQTCSVISGSHLSKRLYLLSKAGFAALTAVLSWIVRLTLC